MTNPTQDSLDHVLKLNGFTALPPDSGFAQKAMRHHALDRDKWLAEKAELAAEITRLNEGWHRQNVAALEAKLNWQDNMGFEPTQVAMQKAVEIIYTPSYKHHHTLARLIDHLEGRAPEKVDPIASLADDLRAEVFASLRKHEVSEDCFAEIAAITQAFKTTHLPAKFKELTNG